MTKKDYELIASVLKQAILFCDDTPNQDDDILLLETLSKRFADTLASKNPRFNKDKFLRACGVEVEKPCNLETCTSKKNRLGICNGLCGCECHCI